MRELLGTPVISPFHQFGFVPSGTLVGIAVLAARFELITNAQHLISCQQLLLHQLQMIGDAMEFMKCIKQSLLEEVTPHRSDDEDNKNDYITSITNFLRMFDSGVVEKSIRCCVCEQIVISMESFEELLLTFDEIHHDKKGTRQSCSLGDMLDFYSRDYNTIVERECQACKQRRKMTQQNRIVTYPQILYIHLSCSTLDNCKIQSSVDFPVENFQPDEYFGTNDEQDDDTTYDLIASVNHEDKPKSPGHYTAVCRQSISGKWYQYDGQFVEVAHFTQRNKRDGTVRVLYQRLATILFYCKRSKQPSLADVSMLSSNEYDDKNHSEFSDNEDNDEGNYNDGNNSNVDNEVNHGKGNNDKGNNFNVDNEVEFMGTVSNSDQTRIEEVSISVISARNNYIMHFIYNSYQHFCYRNFIVLFQETETARITCAWGMEKEIT